MESYKLTNNEGNFLDTVISGQQKEIKTHPEINYSEPNSLSKRLKMFRLGHNSGRVEFRFLSVGHVLLMTGTKTATSRMLVEDNGSTGQSQGAATGNQPQNNKDISNNVDNTDVPGENPKATEPPLSIDTKTNTNSIRPLDDESFTYMQEETYLNKIPVEMTLYDQTYNDDHNFKMIFFINFKLLKKGTQKRILDQTLTNDQHQTGNQYSGKYSNSISRADYGIDSNIPCNYIIRSCIFIFLYRI